MRKYGIYDTVQKAWMGSKHGVWLSDEDSATFALAYLRTRSVWPRVRAEVREFTPDTLVYMVENPGFVMTPMEALEWFEEKRSL